MKRALTILTAGFGALAAAASAQAQDAAQSGTVDVLASVARYCAVGQPELGADAQVNIRNLNANTLTIDQLTDPSTLSTRAASVEVVFDAVCNYPHKLTVESQNNGLWRNGLAGNPQNGFAVAIPYKADVRWGAARVDFDATAAAFQRLEESANVSQATEGQIQLRFEVIEGATNVAANAPLVAGNYSDVLRVTVEPQ